MCNAWQHPPCCTLLDMAGQTTDVEALVGHNIRARREALGWSQADLADRLGALGVTPATQATVAALESAKRRPRLHDLAACCAVLGCSLPDLLDGVSPDDQWQAQALAGTWTPDTDELARIDEQVRRNAADRENADLARLLAVAVYRRSPYRDPDLHGAPNDRALHTWVQSRYGETLLDLREREAAQVRGAQDMRAARQSATKAMLGWLVRDYWQDHDEEGNPR